MHEEKLVSVLGLVDHEHALLMALVPTKWQRGAICPLFPPSFLQFSQAGRASGNVVQVLVPALAFFSRQPIPTMHRVSSMGYTTRTHAPQVETSEAHSLRHGTSALNPQNKKVGCAKTCVFSLVFGRGDESKRQGLNLSGSWQQGHSATYNTPSRI